MRWILSLAFGLVLSVGTVSADVIQWRNTISSPGSTSSVKQADEVAEWTSLREFGTDKGVAPDVAFAAAESAGRTNIILDQSYTWTAGATISVNNTKLRFTARQTKAFNGVMFTVAANNVTIDHAWILAQGGTYTGNVFEATNFNYGRLIDPYCTDFNPSYHFFEVTAPVAEFTSVFDGGRLVSTEGTSSHSGPDGGNPAAIKLYGDNTVGDSPGIASASFNAVGGRVDLGGSREVRYENAQAEWPITWDTSSGWGTNNAHIANSRLVSQSLAGSYTLKGIGHALTGLVVGDDLTIQSSNTSAAGNHFAGNLTLDAAEIRIPRSANRVTGSITLTGNFTGELAASYPAANSSVTITPSDMASVIVANQAMTAARTWTLNTTRAVIGMRRRIMHAASGGFALTIKNNAATTLVSLSNGQYVEVEYNGTDWFPTYVTLANLPSAASMSGMEITISDVGQGGSRWFSNGTEWKPVGEVVIDQAYALTTTSSTEANIRATTIKGKLLQNTNHILIKGISTMTGSANAKVVRVRHFTASGVLGTAYVSNTSGSTTTTMGILADIWEKNDTAKQSALPTALGGTVGGGVVISAGAEVTGTLDTTADTVINLTGSVAGGETLTIADYRVSIGP